MFTVRSLLSALLLSMLVAVPQTSHAASRAAQSRMMAALRLDFGRDGVRADSEAVEAAYRAACEAGYSQACLWEGWRDDDGPSLQLLDEALSPQCARRDAISCVVAGWALEAKAAKVALPVHVLTEAAKSFKNGCDWGALSGCFELAEYRAYGTGVKRNIEAAIKLHRWTCNAGYQGSCAGWGALLEQDAAVAQHKNSAGYLYKRACEAGLVDGCYRYGVLMLPAWTLEESRAWQSAQCDAGHAKACGTFASLHSESTEGADAAVALEASARACELGLGSSCHVAAGGLEATDVTQAMELYQAGCDQGDAASCGGIGRLIEAGQMGTGRARALPYLEQACDGGVFQSCVILGGLYLRGSLVEADVRDAHRLLLKGCTEGAMVDAAACAGLGRIYEDGLGIDRDRPTAARYYGMACQVQDMNSCYRQGLLTEAVHVDERAHFIAIRAYDLACAGGVAEACLPGARLREVGTLDVRDPKGALERYNELCQGGSPEACLAEGMAEEKGIIGEPGFEEARVAYDRGMELGDLECQRRLAHMMWYGRGGKRIKSTSRKLFRDACEQGNRDACRGWR